MIRLWFCLPQTVFGTLFLFEPIKVTNSPWFRPPVVTQVSKKTLRKLQSSPSFLIA